MSRSEALYGIGILTLIGAYLSTWFSNARYVYGWLGDDRLHFLKGLATSHDWRRAFDVYNALHASFFLIAAPLCKIAGSLPSFPLPELQEKTGQFRWFLLAFVVLHAVLIAVWSIFLLRLIKDKAVAFLAVLLWVSSPTFTLWSPQPDSRIAGLLLAIPALWLMFSADFSRCDGWRVPVTLFSAGTLFSLSQSIHYTSLYLIAPMIIVCWSVWVYQYGRKARFWYCATAFGLGVVWWLAWLEAISYFVIHKPLYQGPLAELQRIRTMHLTTSSRLVNLNLWAASFRMELGVPLLILIAVGAWLYWTKSTTDFRSRAVNRLVTASVLCGILYLPLTGAMAFFRQTSVLQPFLFLFAAIAIVRLPRLVLTDVWQRGAATIALLVFAGLVQWQQAWTTYQGHLGLGRALEWAQRNRGSHAVNWFLIWTQIWEPGDRTAINSLEQLLAADPDSLVISEMPWRLVSSRPSLLAALRSVPPLNSFPTLWSTDTVYCEMAPFWPHWPGSDLRQAHEMNEARIYRVGDLQRALIGEKLEIDEVTADSTINDRFEAVNVIDHDISPDQVTRWESNQEFGEHWIKLKFSSPRAIGSTNIIQAAFTPDREGGRIQQMTISALDPAGNTTQVWSGTDLQTTSVISAAWKPTLTTSLTIKIQRQIGKGGPIAAASIEEILFPGFFTVPPHPKRKFPELLLYSVSSQSNKLVATGFNLTEYTQIDVDGRLLASAKDEQQNAIVAEMTPEIARYLEGVSEKSTPLVRLTDGLRYSNALPLALPPLLEITDLQSDSDFGIGYTKANLFDGDRTKGVNAWASGSGDTPHWVSFLLRSPRVLQDLLIVNRPMTRIEALMVEAKLGGAWQKVFENYDLTRYATVKVQLPKRLIGGLRITVMRNTMGGIHRNEADIQEIVVPGFRVAIK